MRRYSPRHQGCVSSGRAIVNGWPITGVTYILIKAKQPDKTKCDALFAYFDWCFTTGANTAEKLNYVGIPPEVIELIKAERAKAITR